MTCVLMAGWPDQRTGTPHGLKSMCVGEVPLLELNQYISVGTEVIYLAPLLWRGGESLSGVLKGP